MNNYTSRLEDIKKKIEKLKGSDTNFRVFGSNHHRYIMNNKLTQTGILNYENKYKISLPEEYIQFLMHIGNGGTGPFYGLFPLEENENDVQVSEIFPYEIDNQFLISGKYDEFYRRADECKTIEEQDIIYAEKDLIADADYINSLKGFIDLSHEGCAMYFILIVNGKDKGTVWFFDFANDFGVVPLINPVTSKPITFLDWYELWLDNPTNPYQKFIKKG